MESQVDKDKTAPGMSDEDSEDSVDDGDGGWDDYGAQDVNDVVNSAAMQMQNAPDLECDIKADRVVPKPLPQVTPGIESSTVLLMVNVVLKTFVIRLVGL